MNDCANLLLACGAVPVMADAPEEVAEITAAADALVLNLGTPGRDTLPAMLAAGRTSAAKNIPIVFDPVGVYASAFRAGIARELLAAVPVTVIRGNRREVSFLAELVCGKSSDDPARALALATGAVVLMTGETDIVTDGKAHYTVHGGTPMLTQITGAGCMLSALTGALLAASRIEAWQDIAAVGAATPGAASDDPATHSTAALAPATVTAVCLLAARTMNEAGERAATRMSAEAGNASCRNYLIDAIMRITQSRTV